MIKLIVKRSVNLRISVLLPCIVMKKKGIKGANTEAELARAAGWELLVYRKGGLSPALVGLIVIL
jgi:hypothetical protein